MEKNSFLHVQNPVYLLLAIYAPKLRNLHLKTWMTSEIGLDVVEKHFKEFLSIHPKIETLAVSFKDIVDLYDDDFMIEKLIKEGKALLIMHQKNVKCLNICYIIRCFSNFQAMDTNQWEKMKNSEEAQTRLKSFHFFSTDGSWDLCTPIWTHNWQSMKAIFLTSSFDPVLDFSTISQCCGLEELSLTKRPVEPFDSQENVVDVINLFELPRNLKFFCCMHVILPEETWWRILELKKLMSVALLSPAFTNGLEFTLPFVQKLIHSRSLQAFIVHKLGWNSEEEKNEVLKLYRDFMEEDPPMEDDISESNGVSFFM